MNTSSVDRLLLMQTFIRIVEAGSLSAAARQLGTTQPTVSRRLQALERQFGQPLVHRSTHARRLTETGERAFEPVQLLYPNPPSPPARLRYFIEAMRRSMAEPLWPDMLATP